MPTYDLSQLEARFSDTSLKTMQTSVGFFAINQVYAAQMYRIFTQGLKVDGTKIGTFKAYTAYFGRSDFNTPSYFTPNTAGGKSFKTNKGWAGLREAEGYQAANVDLEHKRDLRDSLTTEYDNDKTWIFGCKDKTQLKKIDAHEKRYGPIFYDMTAADEAQLKIDINDHLQDLLNSIL